MAQVTFLCVIRIPGVSPFIVIFHFDQFDTSSQEQKLRIGRNPFNHNSPGDRLSPVPFSTPPENSYTLIPKSP